jgi:hypothetical protein
VPIEQRDYGGIHTIDDPVAVHIGHSGVERRGRLVAVFEKTMDKAVIGGIQTLGPVHVTEWRIEVGIRDGVEIEQSRFIAIQVPVPIRVRLGVVRVQALRKPVFIPVNIALRRAAWVQGIRGQNQDLYAILIAILVRIPAARRGFTGILLPILISVFDPVGKTIPVAVRQVHVSLRTFWT